MNLILSRTASDKIDAWVALARGEVSGWGLVDPVMENGVLTGYRVEDVFLVKQECTSGDTDPDQDAMGELVYLLDREGVDTARLRLWWHSHGSMNPFWSGQDRLTIKSWCYNAWYVSLVVNKHGDYKARVDLFEKNLTFGLSLEKEEMDSDLVKWCESVFREKVTESVPLVRGGDFSGFISGHDVGRSKRNLVGAWGLGAECAMCSNDIDDDDRCSDCLYGIEVEDL